MKNSILLFFASAISLLLCFVACQKTPTAELSVSQNEYTVQASGGSVNVNVSSNVDLTVRISAGWITQAGGPSSGGGTYSFTVAHNDGYDARTATITFSNGEQGVSETVTVTQSQQDAIIPGSLEYQLFYEAQTFSLPVSANVDCSVSVSGSDWIKSLGTRGLTTKQYQFSIAENTGKTPREAVVTITSGNLKQSIKVEQLPTTHFPKTKQEWKGSIAMSDAILDVVSDKIENAWKSGPVEKETFLNEILGLDNVIDVRLNGSGSCLGIMQRDSIWVNYSLFNGGVSSFDQVNTRSDIEYSDELEMYSSKMHSGARRLSSDREQGNSYICKKRKALILAPFVNQFDNTRFIKEYIKILKYAGFEEKNIDYYPDKKASIMQFMGDSLSKYDFILINTHGTTGYNARYPKKETAVHDQTVLVSGTPYDEASVADYIEKGLLKSEDIALNVESGKIYLSMTTSFLEGAQFDSTFVILEACESSKILDNSNKGSMIQTFLDRGCAVVSGYDKEVENQTGTWMTKHLMFALAEGLSFSDAVDYLKASPIFADYCEQLKQYYLDEGTYLWGLIHNTTEDDVASIDHKLFNFKPKDPAASYHLMNPYCDLGEEKPSGKGVTFNLASNIYPPSAAFEDNKVDKLNNFRFHMSHRATYDIYVDGKLAKAGLKIESPGYISVYVDNISTGYHHWFVVTHIIDDDTNQTIAYYRSCEKRFNITGPSIPVTGIRLTPSTITLEEGQSSQLTATVYPANATNKKVIWSSNYPESVSVDENGLITAIKRRLGVTIIITAKTEDGEKTATCRVYVNESSSGKVPVTGVSLGQSSAEIKVGDVLQLNATVAPSNATNKTVTWSSSNNSVATVSSSGLVSGKAEGTAKITAKTEDGGKTASVTITVKKADGGSVSVTGVSLDKSSVSLKVGESETLKATVSPSNATNKGLTWTSSMSSVATITSDGVVTAKAAGTATITVKTDDGGKTATCNVTVTYNGDPGGEISVSQVTISPTSANMTVGDTKQFSVKVDPANATNQEVSWSSSEPSVASVDSKGMVTAKAEGKATITVTAKDGGVSSKATVTVSNKVVPVTGVTVSPTSLTMEIGDSKSLTVTVNPADATDKTYTVSSDNTGVVEIDKNNNVVAKGAGTANVTVTTTDGAQTATCKVTVNKPQMTIALDPTSLSFGEVNVGENATKTITISNTGKADVKVSGISVPTAFTIDTSTPFTIAVGKSQTVNVTFTPTEGKDYSGTITITSDTDSQPTVALSGKGVKSSTPSVTVPELVDLGLSVKWASFNLGATKPEEYGDYYTWGETELYYSSLNPLTWKEGKKYGHDWESYKWCNGKRMTLIKYCTNSYFGYEEFTDGKSALEPNDDAAHVHLGGNWWIPTRAEWMELRENCTWTWATRNGVNGVLIKSKNGNSIFLPAGGMKLGTQANYHLGVTGEYWSSTIKEDYPDDAYTTYVSSTSISCCTETSTDYRCYALSIRPVFK